MAHRLEPNGAKPRHPKACDQQAPQAPKHTVSEMRFGCLPKSLIEKIRRKIYQNLSKQSHRVPKPRETTVNHMSRPDRRKTLIEKITDSKISHVFKLTEFWARPKTYETHRQTCPRMAQMVLVVKAPEACRRAAKRTPAVALSN